MQALIEKYNTPTPRYTAYPPANYFTEAFTAGNYTEEIERSNQAGSRHVSIYVHLPFCKNLCFYCGCNSYPEPSQETVDSYLQAVKKEISIVLKKLDPDRQIAQIHYGGGTPNLLPASQLAALNQWIFSFLKPIEHPEIAIECHPAFLTESEIDGLKKAGFNRFSIGVQDFNLEVLRAVNRMPARMPVSDLVNYLREGHTDISVNLDLIYGLPVQNVESFAETIRQAIAVQPDRLVTFSYAHVPWVNKNQEKLEEKGLPDLQTKTTLFLNARDQLIQNGYHSIGIDHFVRIEDELYEARQHGQLHRNFQGYCTRRTTGQVYAFGVSAISQLADSYAQNTKSVAEYVQRISENKLATVKGYRLSRDESAIRTLLTGLMCNEQIVWQEAAQATGRTEDELKSLLRLDPNQLADFVSDGLITCQPEGIILTERGRLFTRNVAAALDPQQQPSDKKFSKTL